MEQGSFTRTLCLSLLGNLGETLKLSAYSDVIGSHLYPWYLAEIFTHTTSFTPCMHSPPNPATMMILPPAVQRRRPRFRVGSCFVPDYNKEVSQPQLPCTAHHSVLVMALSTLVKIQFFSFQNKEQSAVKTVQTCSVNFVPPATIRDFDLMRPSLRATTVWSITAFDSLF